MTDAGRKDIGDKMQNKMTPDSSKSTMDQVKDTVTGVGDKAQRDVIPDSQKSTSQSMQDKASREKDSHTGGGESILDKAKSAVGMDK